MVITTIDFKVGTYFGLDIVKIGGFYRAYLGRKLIYEAHTRYKLERYIDKL